MARIRYSAIVTEIAGSIGGSTFQRNAYGFTVKNKPNMVVPNRVRQQRRKRGFAAQTQKWRLLTQPQRDQWISYATAFPVPSRLNPDSILNGFNVFVRYHLFRSVFQPDFVLTNPFGTQASITAVDADSVAGPGEFLLGVDTVFSGGPLTLLVYMTRQIGDGQVFVQGTPIFLRSSGVAPSLTLSLIPSYQDVFGSNPPAGSRVGLRLVYVNISAGQVIDNGTEILLIDPI